LKDLLLHPVWLLKYLFEFEQQDMQKFFNITAVLFSLFILSIIYLANTGGNVAAMTAVRSVMHGDKIAHFFLFGTLGFVLNLAFFCKTWRWFGIPIYRGTALVLLFAIIEESSQYFITRRNFDLMDMLADVLGLLFFAIFTRCVYPRLTRTYPREKNSPKMKVSRPR
jgi:hypothetical protein